MGEFEGKRALIVAAVSTPEQAEDDKESMGAQEADGLSWCKAEKCEVVDIVRIPGFSRNFLTFRELIEAAEEKKEFGPTRFWEHIQAADFDVLVVRATNRFSREQSLNAEVISRVIRMGGSIYSLADGHIHKRNYRSMATITGYRDAVELDEMKRRRALGIAGRVKRGWPITKKPPMSHRIIFNPDTGEEEAVVLRAEYIPMWNDLAALLLENVSYQMLEQELFTRWGYGNNGKPYPVGKMNTLLFTTYFWGNNAIHWTGRSRPHWRGLWMFDPSCPPPEGVDIYYNTHVPTYEGDLAEQVKTELRRRTEVSNGAGAKYGVGKFTGLVLCDKCHGRFGYSRKTSFRKTFIYLVCSSYRGGHLRGQCDAGRGIREDRVEAFLTPHIERWIKKGLVTFDDRAKTNGQKKQLADLEASEKRLDKRLSNFMVMAGDAEEDMREDWQAQIRTAKDELKRCQEQLSILRKTTIYFESALISQQTGLKYIERVGIKDFWNDDPLVINQTLHAILGNTRVVIKDGNADGFIDLRELDLLLP